MHEDSVRYKWLHSTNIGGLSDGGPRKDKRYDFRGIEKDTCRWKDS